MRPITNRKLLEKMGEAIQKASPEELAEFRVKVREQAGLPARREKVLEEPEEKGSKQT